METVKRLWLTLEINNHTMLNLLISSVLLKAQFTFCQYIDFLSGAELFRWRTAIRTGMQGSILLFIIDLWLNPLLLYVNETLLTFLVLYLLIEGLSIPGRYMWLNWGQPKEQKLKSKAKRRDYSAAISTLLLWPMSWGIVAIFLSAPVQLPDAQLDLWACACNAHFQGHGWAASPKESLDAGCKCAFICPCSSCPFGAMGQPNNATEWWKISATVRDSFQSYKLPM